MSFYPRGGEKEILSLFRDPLIHIEEISFSEKGEELLFPSIL